MKTLLWIFLAVGLVYTVTATAQNKIDSAFWPYMQTFVKEANLRHAHVSEDAAEYLSIKFGKDMSTVASCNSHDHHISIRQSWWETHSNMEKERLLFEELAICFLQEKKISNDKFVASSLEISNEYYLKNRKAFLDMLFSGVN